MPQIFCEHECLRFLCLCTQDALLLHAVTWSHGNRWLPSEVYEMDRYIYACYSRLTKLVRLKSLRYNNHSRITAMTPIPLHLETVESNPLPVFLVGNGQALLWLASLLPLPPRQYHWLFQTSGWQFHTLMVAFSAPLPQSRLILSPPPRWLYYIKCAKNLGLVNYASVPQDHGSFEKKSCRNRRQIDRTRWQRVRRRLHQFGSVHGCCEVVVSPQFLVFR